VTVPFIPESARDLAGHVKSHCRIIEVALGRVDNSRGLVEQNCISGWRTQWMRSSDKEIS